MSLFGPKTPRTPAPPPKPIINPEADRAIFKVMVKWGMLTFCLAVLLPIGYITLQGTHPHNRLFGIHSPLQFVFAGIWIIIYQFGASKVANLRLDYGRTYFNEKRWKESVAALDQFAEWGQRSFDRTGEAHYMLSVGLDRLGRREKAEKMRKFVRDKRSGTEWAIKCGAPIPAAAEPKATHTLRKTTTVSADSDGTRSARAGAASRTRRRRF
jgi:hypothetical protein